MTEIGAIWKIHFLSSTTQKKRITSMPVVRARVRRVIFNRSTMPVDIMPVSGTAARLLLMLARKQLTMVCERRPGVDWKKGDPNAGLEVFQLIPGALALV